MTKVPYTHHVERGDSSAISDLYWDLDTQNMYVAFKSGSFAGYSGVPLDVFFKAGQSDSVGAFYNDRIRYTYPGNTLPYAPEMEDRNKELEETSYEVTLTVLVPHADSPGDAIDFLSKGLGYTIKNAEVRPVT